MHVSKGSSVLLPTCCFTSDDMLNKSKNGDDNDMLTEITCCFTSDETALWPLDFQLSLINLLIMLWTQYTCMARWNCETAVSVRFDKRCLLASPIWFFDEKDHAPKHTYKTKTIPWQRFFVWYNCTLRCTGLFSLFRFTDCRVHVIRNIKCKEPSNFYILYQWLSVQNCLCAVVSRMSLD